MSNPHDPTENPPDAEEEGESTEGSAPEAEQAPTELEEVKAQLEMSQAKGREMMERLKDTHDKMLRATADLDNYKKRSIKEREDVVKYGNEKLLKDFLPVLDNLDRAMEHAASPSDFEALKKGIQMTRKQFEDALSKNGVKPFLSKGEPFDPHRHEAMQQVETDEVPTGHVVQELQRGFFIQDRLLRPALVTIAKGQGD